MNRAHVRQRPKNPIGSGGGGGFQPSTLFATGEQGLWLDPSDLTTMFQDDAGTTPVTAAGQVVGLIRDKSGNDNHATQATAASKPILRNTGALWWLEFDGVDDFLVTANINLTATDKASFWVGATKSSDATTGMIIETSVSASANDGAFYLTGPQGNGTSSYGVVLRGTTETGSSLTTFTAPITNVISVNYDIAQPGRATEILPRVNGLVPTRGNIGAAADAGSGNLGNHPLYVGRRGGTLFPFNGLIYGVIIRGSRSDALTISGGEGYMASKSGVVL